MESRKERYWEDVGVILECKTVDEVNALLLQGFEYKGHEKITTDTLTMRQTKPVEPNTPPVTEHYIVRTEKIVHYVVRKKGFTKEDLKNVPTPESQHVEKETPAPEPVVFNPTKEKSKEELDKERDDRIFPKPEPELSPQLKELIELNYTIAKWGDGIRVTEVSGEVLSFLASNGNRFTHKDYDYKLSNSGEWINRYKVKK